MAQAAGTLNVVATPIGNLKDITLRAIEVLKASDLIVSEDTRETAKILQTLNINPKQISYRDQNHDSVFLSILNDLLGGKNVTLVSDNGTPTISDPGFKLIRDLRKNSFTQIKAIPGPSAVIAALSIAGLPTDKFCFIGFLPKKVNDRKNELLKVKDFEGTLIVYESPLRVLDLLKELEGTLGDRFVALCFELTKVNERVETGYITELLTTLAQTEPKGEVVVLISKKGFNYD